VNAVSECSVQSPLLLFLGIGVTLMAWGLIRLRDDVRLTRAHLLGVSALSTHPLRVAALCIGLLAMLSALARPYCGMERVEVPYFGADRVIVFDVSQSMLTRDLGSTRLAVAKRKANDYVRRLVEEGRSDRIGLVLFAGNAYQYCPLTSDHAVLKQFIENISPQLVASLGSNLAAGLEVALHSLKRAKSRTGEVLVISDGESGSELDRQLSGLRKLRVIVDALGIGTTRGKPIEVDQGRFLRDERNEIVVSRLESAALEKLAQDTGGRYTAATVSGDADLDVLIAETAACKVVVLSWMSTTNSDRGYWSRRSCFSSSESFQATAGLFSGFWYGA
jgi:Mg-chelatase subunit ChlD